ncbi:MAG: NFACT family protein, partial [Deltaproteobacteria bacterium]
MKPSVIRHILVEINERLSGGVVSRVHQMDERNILLKIFSRGSQECLIISAHPKFARIHLTGEAFINPPAPLRFCAYLRSRITGARIEGFTQADGERIVDIGVKKPYDGSVEPFTLVAELTGKSSNIILIDGNGIVLDALRYFDVKSAIRAVTPG